MSKVCGFCKGQPVGNAARWTSLDAPRYAPCPRCGYMPTLPPDAPATYGALPQGEEDAA